MEYQEYEILFGTEEKTEGKENAIVEYNPDINRPFIVYELNKETLEYEMYSGEDKLETAIEVANSLI